MPATGLTKHNLLSYLAGVNDADANGVASAFAVDYPAAAMALLRLVRQGLVSRRRNAERGAYRYRLSERGQSRLKYLEGWREASR